LKQGESLLKFTRYKEVTDMENEIHWEKELDTALARAKAENKPVLMDFFNPG
jgi:hypothetical protein